MPVRILLGSARSGTTWLQDALARSNGLRTIFEPLHPDGDRRAEQFAYRYLLPTDESAELEAYLRELLFGREIRLWSDLRVNPTHLLRWQSPLHYAAQGLYIARGLRRHVPERGYSLLVKFIRANLMGGWLAVRFQARVLLVVRHPCSVIASQLRLDPSAWHDFRELYQHYLSDEKLASGPLVGLRGYLAGLSDPFEIRTALWCIENAIPSRSASDDGVGVVFYEELLLDHDAAWTNALATLDLVHRPTSEVLNEPSQQASVDRKATSSADSTISRWQTRLDEDQKRKIQGVLDRFEVGIYSTADPMPLLRSSRAEGSV